MIGISRFTRLCVAVALALGLSAVPTTAEEAAAKPSAPFQKAAPKGAPNVVIVLLDDVGFAMTSAFGGPVETPALDALARDGLRYNRFHTTAICSPTRASLLTGQNPHATGIGSVINSADARPGYKGVQRPDAGSIAEILRQNGYSTAAFGKWHQTPDWEATPIGPFDRWPVGQGFEKFYGFLGGETDQFDPTLVEGTTPVLRPAGEDYFLNTDLADKSIEWLRLQHSLMPDKPFFLYLAPGAVHAPIQVPEEWIDRYKGRFGEGWDKLRERILERQKRLGVVPQNTVLTPRPGGLPAWNGLNADERAVAERYMEAYAGFMANTDYEVGRLIAALKESGQFDNTLFVYIVGDNGASSEGGVNGNPNYLGRLFGMPEPTAAQVRERIDEIGSEEMFAHVNAAWAWALDTPFQYVKTVASHLGGTRNGMIISWPRRIDDGGGIRSQFGHVNDIAPTILEAIGLSQPRELNGVVQRPMDGTSLLYSFEDAEAPDRHRTQYFEVFGHRSIYHDGWMASAFHTRIPWGPGFQPDDKPFEADKWELYDLRNDFSQAHDLAKKYPAKLAELKSLFEQEAAANDVLPLATQPDQTGLPNLGAGVTHIAYYPGARGIPEKELPSMAFRSWTLTAQLDNGGDARGVLATLGGHTSGWSLYLDEAGRPVFKYRAFDAGTAKLEARDPLPAGRNVVTLQFDYAGPGPLKGARMSLIVNGQRVASGEVPITPPGFSISETFDVGMDTGSPGGDYPASAAPGYAFTGGTIDKVEFDLR